MKNYLLIFITALLCFAASCSGGTSGGADITTQERGTAPFRLNWSDCAIGEGHDCRWYCYSPPNELYGDVESVTIRFKDPDDDPNINNSECKLLFEFNDHGDVSSLTLIDPCWSPEPVITTYNYTYNSSGKATNCTIIRGQNSEYGYDIAYVYGPQGNLIGEKNSDGSVNNYELEIYEYNSDGVLAKSRCNYSDDVDSYRVTYYGANGLKTYSLDYGPEDIPHKTYYYYNDKDQLTSEVWYNPFETPKNEYVVDLVVNYEYDDKGYMIKAVRHYYPYTNDHHNDSYKPSESVYIANYKYDSKGNIIDDGGYTYEIEYR